SLAHRLLRLLTVLGRIGPRQLGRLPGEFLLLARRLVERLLPRLLPLSARRLLCLVNLFFGLLGEFVLLLGQSLGRVGRVSRLRFAFGGLVPRQLVGEILEGLRGLSLRLGIGRRVEVVRR